MATKRQIEEVARVLCLKDGLDPNERVTHAFGDDFTAEEWERLWTSDTTVSGKPVVSPMWRLYRARAMVELSRHAKVKYGGNVVPFRRPNA